MIIPLEGNLIDYGSPGGQPREWPHFTCIHFDTETRLCKNYANRPLMCSDFPYDAPRRCHHCNLTRDEIEGRDTAKPLIGIYASRPPEVNLPHAHTGV